MKLVKFKYRLKSKPRLEIKDTVTWTTQVVLDEFYYDFKVKERIIAIKQDSLTNFKFSILRRLERHVRNSETIGGKGNSIT